MKKIVLVLLSTVWLSGCGAVYFSSTVPEDDPGVDVVPLTSLAVRQANGSRYTPKSLPGVFFQTAGGGGAQRGAGALPEGSLDRPVRPEALQLRVPPSADPGAYKIGVGDVLLLSNTAASRTREIDPSSEGLQINRQGYAVQDDGAIAVPNVGRIEVAGLTLEEAEAALFGRLVENRIDPSFGLEIGEFRSRRVSVGGAVASPQVVPVQLTPLYLDQAIAATGGISAQDLEFATIRIYRDGDLYQIPLRDYLAKPELQKVRLVNGDSIFVDTEFQLEQAQAYFEEQIALTQIRATARAQALNELDSEIARRRAALNEARANYQVQLELDAVDRDYVYLAGEVSSPSRFTMPFGRDASLADALFSEKGFDNMTGNPTQIYVLRGTDDDRVQALHLDARNATNYVLATRLELRPNDIIFVAEQPITRWNRVVQQIVPSIFSSAAVAANNI